MGVFVNSGIGSQILMVPETTYGVAPSLATAQPYEFNSEGLELKKTTVQSQGLHAGGLYNRGARRVLTNYEAMGPIAMDLPTRYLNQLLWFMFGSKTQATAALVQDATTGAYSATHAPGSMKSLSACIQKGAPSVDGTAANPFTYVGMKVTDWTIAVQTGAIASLALTWDGRNELAGTGNGDPLNGSVPALGVFSEAASNSVFHFREATLLTGGTLGVAAQGSALSSPPAVPATTVAAANPYGVLTAVTITGTVTSVIVNGVQVGTSAGTYAVPAGGTIALAYGSAPTWAWFAGITTISGATAAGNVKSAEVKCAFHYDNARYFLGSNGFKGEQLENNYRDISGQFVIEWLNSAAQYNAFAADTSTALQLNFTGGIIGSGSDHSSLSLLIPQIFLDGESPKVGGPAIVTQTVPFTGLDDGTNNPIQATYWTLDSA